MPGFTIRSLDERRGLGQATQNVLINGERISGKSNDAATALTRINAADVERIEIVDGATLDIPGLTGEVANVIVQVRGLSGNFRWEPGFRARRTPPSLFGGEISISGESGALDYTLSLSNNDAFRNGNKGHEIVTDGAGNVIDLRDEVLTVNGDQPRVAAILKYETPGGLIANFNGSYERLFMAVREDSFRSFPGMVDRVRDFDETEREWNYELGGDVEFGLGSGRLKLIGLRRFEHSAFRVKSFFSFADGRPDEGSLFRRVADEGETIARAEYRWKGGGSDWQVAAEGALNTLDNVGELAVLDASGVLRPVPLAGGTATVEEKRAEVSASYGRPLSPTLTLQTSLGGEYSKIVQDGAGGLNRTFYRPKGFVSLAWKASPRLDLSAKLERQVGELNLFDFVASVNLAGGNSNSANPDLRPPQTWLLEGEATRNLGVFGQVKARAFAEFITDAVAQVPIGATGEAPGNIDSATRVGLDLTNTFTLDPLGLKGAKLDVKAQFRRGRLADPLTGERRQFSESLAREVEIDFRHDPPRSDWAYGGNYSQFHQTRGVRLDQVSQFRQQPGDLGFFIENKDVFGLTVRGGVSNLLGINERFFRTVFAGRRTDPVLFTEDRSRYSGLIFDFSIRGSI